MFGGSHSKIGMSPELNIIFGNVTHQIEGNQLLYDKKEKVLYRNLDFAKMSNILNNFLNVT